MARRAQPYPIAQLTKGLDVAVDATLIADQSAVNAMNLRYDRGLIKKDLGWAPFGAVADDYLLWQAGDKLLQENGSGLLLDVNNALPLQGTVMHFDTFYLQAGSEYGIICTNKYAYYFNDTDQTYTIINALSGGSPVPFGGDEDDNFCSNTVLDNTGADIFVLSNGIDQIQKWTGTGQMTDLGGLVNKTAKINIPFMNRLILGFITDSGFQNPRRVMWSVVGDPEDYTNPGSGFVDLTDTVDWVIAFGVIRDKLFVIKERSIWELVYVGGTVYFKPELRIDGTGSYCAKACTNLGDEMLIFGSDNVYIFDGLDLIPIGDQLFPLLYVSDTKIVNSSKLSRSPGVYIEELQEWWITIPVNGSEVPNRTLKYSFIDKAWAMKDEEATAYGYYSVPAGNIWAMASGRWVDQVGSWMDKPLPSGAPTTLRGDSDGIVWEDDRLTPSSLTMTFETKDWIWEHASRITEFRVQAKGGPFTIYYSMDGGSTWSAGQTFAAVTSFTEFSLPLNITTQMLRCRITSNADEMEIKWIEPWYIPRARSKTLAVA